ncbi:MAG TPA: CPBP family intramembrane glutamic endopeptidase [Candidatus Binatia bacterium]|nr:CPBP family intramembrane glutamic endopeptidase [Candidatus Binatia bacterium]
MSFSQASLVPPWSVSTIAAAAILLCPVLALAFAGDRFVRRIDSFPLAVRPALPAIAALAYFLATYSTGYFRWAHVALYAAVPVLLVLLLQRAAARDPQQLGDWRDFAVLALLGWAVEFRLLEPAWPPELRWLNRLLLLGTALYGFLAVRRLAGVGFNFFPRLSDLKTGLRELAFYALIALPLGLGLGFLHVHAVLPGLGRLLLSWISMFAFVAVLEETYFRGWLQNLLERRIGRRWSLALTAVLFGLSHFNKGATRFNWRYVLLATLAGIFYGRAWRENRRLLASAITHASVDTIWMLWLR